MPMPEVPRIRIAREDELRAIREIEFACEQRFVDAGIGFGPRADPAVIPEAYRASCRDGALLVAVDAGDRPIGFAVLDAVDGATHLAELDVSPSVQGRGVGTLLIEAVCGFALGRGHRAVTLTTFREVRWNGPYYVSRGFVVLDPATVGPGLAAILADEDRRGLEGRCAMRRTVGGR